MGGTAEVAANVVRYSRKWWGDRHCRPGAAERGIIERRLPSIYSVPRIMVKYDGDQDRPFVRLLRTMTIRVLRRPIGEVSAWSDRSSPPTAGRGRRSGALGRVLAALLVGHPRLRRAA